VSPILDNVGKFGELRCKQYTLKLCPQFVPSRYAFPETGQFQFPFYKQKGFLRQVNQVADPVFLVYAVRATPVCGYRFSGQCPDIAFPEYFPLEHSEQGHLFFPMKPVCRLLAGVYDAPPQLLQLLVNPVPVLTKFSKDCRQCFSVA